MKSMELTALCEKKKSNKNPALAIYDNIQLTVAPKFSN